MPLDAPGWNGALPWVAQLVDLQRGDLGGDQVAPQPPGGRQSGIVRARDLVARIGEVVRPPGR